MKGANRQFKPQRTGKAAILAALASAFGQSDPLKLPTQAKFFQGARMRSSRYMPHQGPKEMDRRVRQRAAGIIS